LIAALLLPMCGGCQVLGYAAAVMPEAPTKARYAGLAGQRVAVMTWVERGTYEHYQWFGWDVRLDLSSQVTSKILAAQKADEKILELKGTTLVDAKAVYKWQKNHPEMEIRSATEMAPALAAATGATRVIFIEVQPFMTLDPKTQILLKGYAQAQIHVVEVDHGATARQAYAESEVTANFPDNVSEGLPPTGSVDETYIYRNLVDALSTEIAVRFFTYVDPKA
jgi:hypothetical protein